MILLQILLWALFVPVLVWLAYRFLVWCCRQIDSFPDAGDYAGDEDDMSFTNVLDFNERSDNDFDFGGGESGGGGASSSWGDDD